MSPDTSRVGVISPEPSGLSERVREAGGEPVPLPLPGYPEGWGVALVREWIADALEVPLTPRRPEALLFEADSPAELAGVIAAAVRLEVPAVCAAGPETTFTAAVAGLGLVPLGDEGAVETAVRLASEEGMSVRDLVDNFSTANALRVGLSLGGGPEFLVHLSAVAREAGVAGFPQMARVLLPETPALTTTRSAWFRENGVPGILASLGEDLHDARTVSDSLMSHAHPADGVPGGAGFGYSLLKARTSGAESFCRVPDGVKEISGECRVFGSEAEATEALVGGDGPAIAVVRGVGPRGTPGMRVLEDLSRVLEEGAGEVVVITDGLAPEGASGVWASAFAPESAAGGILSRLADGDLLKLDLVEGRILTAVERKDISRRKQSRPLAVKSPPYAARYARHAVPAFDGAAFG